MIPSKQSGAVWIRLVLCTLILAAGFGGFVGLKKMKKPPVQTTARERPLTVDGIEVSLTDFPVRVSGFGEVRSRSVVPISAEVSGRVTAVHPRLHVGEVINEGEVLIALDDRDQRLEYDIARARLQTLQRDHELAIKEHERLKTLYERNKAGTLSAVEKAESAVNAIADRRNQVEQALHAAELRIERSVIRAPFSCRVTETMVEQYEYVTPGKKLMTITDDSDLEIIVSLDSRDVIGWLRFDPGKSSPNGNWFAGLTDRECQVEWTDDASVNTLGRVDRIVRFDPTTRTLLVAVRLVHDPKAVVPVVDGMFCRVTIPGEELQDVVVLPRQAVSFESTVYVAANNWLRTRPVTVARLDHELAIISGGLQPGEIVVTTRLEQPLENALLTVTLGDNGDR